MKELPDPLGAVTRVPSDHVARCAHNRAIAAVEFAIDKGRIPARFTMLFSPSHRHEKRSAPESTEWIRERRLAFISRESAAMVQRARPRGPVQNAKQALALLFLSPVLTFEKEDLPRTTRPRGDYGAGRNCVEERRRRFRETIVRRDIVIFRSTSLSLTGARSDRQAGP